MRAMIGDLFPLLFRWFALVGLIAASYWAGASGRTVIYWLWLVILLLHAWRLRWAWRLALRTRHFATLSGARVVLRYPAELAGEPTPHEVLAQAEEALEDLEKQFGSRLKGGLLRRKVYVFAFPSSEPIQAVFGEMYWGTALAELHAVVVTLGTTLTETLRHELAHLFSLRLQPSAIPLLSEGLSTWLQYTEQGVTIDGAAAILLRTGGAPQLRQLLCPRFFFAEATRHQCYVLAGSFTGFLISRLGWDEYRELYRYDRGRWGFEGRFEKRFGMSLEEAESAWREELFARYDLLGSCGLPGWWPG